MTQCRIIRRQTVSAANLTSNVPETGSTYSALATYALADVVIALAGDGLTHSYESLVAGNLGNALTDETRWLDLGATNRFAMFDDVNGTQTSLTSDVDVTIACAGRVDTLALLNLDATSVQVTMTAAGATVSDRTISLVETAYTTDWYSYFTEDVTYKDELVLTDLPAYSGASLRVQINKGGGTRACGAMVLGLARALGGTLYGASVGIRDFSKKVTDSDFGTTSLVERAYAKTGSFKLVTDALQADANSKILAEYRARPTMWIGTDDYASTWIFGFYRDWSTEFVFQGKNYVNLNIEGLI